MSDSDLRESRTQNSDRFVDWEPSLLHALLERLPVVEGHHDVELAVLFADVVDSCDVRMVDGAGGARLLNEARLGRLVADQMPGEKLDGYCPLELEVRRSIEKPHPAGAQPLLEPVVLKHAADERVLGIGRRFGFID